MSNPDLEFLHRYARNLTPEAVYDAATGEARARGLDAHPDPRDPILEPDDERRAVQLSRDSAEDDADDEVKPDTHPELTDDISLAELVAQLQRPFPVRTNPDNAREADVPWRTRQERGAEEWLTGFEYYLEQVLALPPRERRMAIHVLAQHAHTLMSAIERRAVDLRPDDPRLARLDRLAEGLERFVQEYFPATAFSGAIARQQEERQRIPPMSDLEKYAARAKETIDAYDRMGKPAEVAARTRARTADQQPQSDLEFYERCAAESTRLA